MEFGIFHDKVVKVGLIVKKLRISRGCQISVPSETRERYDLRPGDELLWIDMGEEILIKPLRRNAKLTDLVGKYDTEDAFDSVAEHDEAVSGGH